MAYLSFCYGNFNSAAYISSCCLDKFDPNLNPNPKARGSDVIVAPCSDELSVVGIDVPWYPADGSFLSWRPLLTV